MTQPNGAGVEAALETTSEERGQYREKAVKASNNEASGMSLRLGSHREDAEVIRIHGTWMLAFLRDFDRLLAALLTSPAQPDGAGAGEQVREQAAKIARTLAEEYDARERASKDHTRDYSFNNVMEFKAETARQIEAEILAIPLPGPAQAQPGWRLVPIEPTEAQPTLGLYVRDEQAQPEGDVERVAAAVADTSLVVRRNPITRAILITAIAKALHDTDAAREPAGWLVRWTEKNTKCSRLFHLEGGALRWAANAPIKVEEIVAVYTKEALHIK